MESRTLLSRTLIVTNDHDSGPGSLRAAVELASTQEGDRIVFARSLAGKTIALTSGELLITSRVEIKGLGAGELTISGGGSSRIITVEGGGPVTISNLKLIHGVSTDGGAVLNGAGATLTLANDILTQNEVFAGNNGTSAAGGAAENLGTLRIIRTSIVENQANGLFLGNSEGAGIANFGSLVVTGSHFAENQANSGPSGGLAEGGGIASFGPLAVRRSTFTNNLALGGVFSAVGLGGGIMVSGGTEDTISHSAFAGDRAVGGTGSDYGGAGIGGGVESTGTTLTVSRSTFTDDEARGGDGTGGPGGYSEGGGISLITSTGLLKNCVFLNDMSRAGTGDGQSAGGLGAGGGVDVSSRSTAALLNSRLRGNQARGGGKAGVGGFGVGGGLSVGIYSLLLPDGSDGSSVTVARSAIVGSKLTGGAGGLGRDGGDGLGGGVWFGRQGRGDVTHTAITANAAVGGPDPVGGRAGRGIGGGVYIADGADVRLAVTTRVVRNRASTSHDDVFGTFHP
jgi:hypothetical protein